MARTEYVAQVMVRLTADDYGHLVHVALPNEPRAHTFVRVMREAVLPRTCLLEYRKAPLFPDWLRWGPHSPLAAEYRGRQLLASGFEVRVVEVEPTPPAPAHPEDDDDDNDDTDTDPEE
jgi:hypothetical protein